MGTSSVLGESGTGGEALPAVLAGVGVGWLKGIDVKNWRFCYF